MKLTVTDSPPQTKEQVVATLADDITRSGFHILDQDSERPWGAFFVIDETQIDAFTDQFFAPLRDVVATQLASGLPLTPKILTVAPGQPLSWQYHHRRREIWHVAAGPVGLVLSDTNELPAAIEAKQTGDIIAIAQGERHRLIGLDSWGVVAEIWLHTDADQPSDEDDIIRVADNYGRTR